MGVDIDNQEIAPLNGLPGQYESIITTLDSLGHKNSVVTPEVGKIGLLEEERRRDMRLDNNQMESAIFNNTSKMSIVPLGAVFVRERNKPRSNVGTNIFQWKTQAVLEQEQWC